jgi:hypothetical protein
LAKLFTLQYWTGACLPGLCHFLKFVILSAMLVAKFATWTNVAFI